MSRVLEDIVYGPDRWHLSGAGLILPGGPRDQRKHPTCIDLFAGCGGFSLGFIQAGWEVVAGLDNEEAAVYTYLTNLGGYPVQIHYSDDEARERLQNYFEKTFKGKKGQLKALSVSGSGWIKHNPGVPPVRHFFFGDIRKFTGKQILDALGIEVGELDCVIGGPPCQGFSTSGKRNVMDPRNSLIFEFARMIVEMQPKTMAMENVPGILSMVTPEGLPVVDAFTRILQDGGFGTIDALKRSLLSSAGVGAALRSKAKKPKAKPATKKAKKQAEQGVFAI